MEIFSLIMQILCAADILMRWNGENLHTETQKKTHNKLEYIRLKLQNVWQQ